MAAIGSKMRLRRSQTHFMASNLYKKTRLCSFHQVGACNRGSACNFAHGEADLREMPDFSKTRICKAFANGSCELGVACRFAHGQHELKAKKPKKSKETKLVWRRVEGKQAPPVALSEE
ncbi:unnamed protein product, partial [Effrenium voratum]